MSEKIDVRASGKTNYGSNNNNREEDCKQTSRARQAYQNRDIEAARLEHAKPHSEPHGSEASDYVKSVVFGGLDGIMTTFAIIAAAAGSNTAFTTILVFGFSNVVADAFSMGFGEYVSGSAELDHARSERAREEWEVENAKDMEIAEMIELYQEKGLSEEDATALVGIISKDNKVFVDFMMADELGILVDFDDVHGPLKQGFVMFCAFITFGSVPLLAYLFMWSGQGMDRVFAASCMMTAVALLMLGAIKGFLTGINIPRAAVLMMINGIISGLVSFSISSAVDALVNV